MENGDAIDFLVDTVDSVDCNKCGSTIDITDTQPFSHIDCPYCQTRLPIPGLLGQFVLFKEMGKGAMGAVYQGFDQTLKRHVAIKVMHRDLGKDPQFVENFLREARSLASLNHVNVVQIYSCGQEKGQPYIIMELVAGGRLDAMLQENKQLEEVQILEIGLDVAKGLSAANEIGLIHGDIKPQNILIDKKGTGKVVDFGLARTARKKHEISEVWGTPYYIAPEKALKKSEDHRTDLYSLGGTLFHALAGRPPFEGKTAQDVVLARLEEPAPHLHEVRPDITKETADMIARLLEADPGRRYPNYESLIADMEKALEAARKGPRVVVDEEQKKSNKKPALLTGISLLVTAVLTIAIVAIINQGGKKKAPKGRVVMKVMNNQLAPVAADINDQTAPFNTDPKQVKIVLTSRDGRGADTSIRGGPAQKKNFGPDPVLTVKSLGNKKLGEAGKAYVRLDLAFVRSVIVTNAALTFTVAEDLGNGSDKDLKLNLWGMDMPRMATWDEGDGGVNERLSGKLTWLTAPGNDPKSAARLTKGGELIAQVVVPGNMKAGDTITIPSEKSVKQKEALVQFIIRNQSRPATFVLTANSGGQQKTGWRLASKENKEHPPPTLSLQAKKAGY